MNKICTSLEQSKKLIKLGIDVNTADMYWWYGGKIYYVEAMDDGDFNEREGHIPCWSLAALLGVIREIIGYTLYGVNNVYISCDLGDKPWKLETEVYDNEVDACYEMIIKLKEQNLI